MSTSQSYYGTLPVRGDCLCVDVTLLSGFHCSWCERMVVKLGMFESCNYGLEVVFLVVFEFGLCGY